MDLSAIVVESFHRDARSIWLASHVLCTLIIFGRARLASTNIEEALVKARGGERSLFDRFLLLSGEKLPIVCRGCRVLYISSFILILFFRRIILYVLHSSFLDFVRFVSCFVRLLTFSRDETLLFHRAKSHMYTRVSS